MKKLLMLLCIIVLILPLFTVNACNNGPKDKVKMWITPKNPNDPQLTTLTSEQTANITIWASSTTGEEVRFTIYLIYNNTAPVKMTNVITEGTDNVSAVGGFISPLQGGTYTLRAVSSDTGQQVGVLKFNVTGGVVLPKKPITLTTPK